MRGETLRTLTIGDITLTVTTEDDNNPDTDWLGEYSNYRQPRTNAEKLVHRASGLVLDHHGIWRDERGRIQAAPEAPEAYRYSREYRYTWHDNGHDTVRYALADSRRLEQINDGDVYFVGVVATVTLDGAEIGYASIWGISSDSDADYFAETAREEAREALHEARTWLGRRKVHVA